ncbi:hypothetical protein G7Y89_g14548 [Cudoniella acicularis]|uniref:Hydrophobin n=1 Tax=Cudoniella acicularis TaxID=354080 RepID=A0A8H4VVJ3_9HELO|nr:hypothetical protein G7Y89_g14548 [Cudoniella acicularis]
MQFSTIIATLFAGLVTASPMLQERQDPALGVCSQGTQVYCCDADVLGLAGVDCAAPSNVPQNNDDFRNQCQATR